MNIEKMMAERDERAAFEAGKDAFEAGDARDSCGFPSSRSDLNAAWLKGWDAAAWAAERQAAKDRT